MRDDFLKISLRLRKEIVKFMFLILIAESSASVGLLLSMIIDHIFFFLHVSYTF